MTILYSDTCLIHNTTQCAEFTAEWAFRDRSGDLLKLWIFGLYDFNIFDGAAIQHLPLSAFLPTCLSVPVPVSYTKTKKTFNAPSHNISFTMRGHVCLPCYLLPCPRLLQNVKKCSMMI